MKIGYARVSTEGQDLALQLDALKAAGCERIIEEKASGSKTDRPELAHLLADLRTGDVLVVWKLDRLARSLRHLVEVVEQLKERGVGFQTLTEAIDTTSNGGRLMFHIFAALAEFERDVIRERVGAGLKAARARGRVGGRKQKMSAQDVKIARQLMAAGEMSSAEVAEHFDVSRAALYATLKRCA